MGRSRYSSGYTGYTRSGYGRSSRYVRAPEGAPQANRIVRISSGRDYGRQKRYKDVYHNLELSMRDLYYGVTCPVVMSIRTYRRSGRFENVDREFIVNVQAGSDDGDQIIFEHDGDEKYRYAPGHVIFAIRAIPATSWTRTGDQLEVNILVDRNWARFGQPFEYRHLTGEIKLFEFKPETGSVETFGTITLPEWGMPRYSEPGHFGPLVIHYYLVKPNAPINDPIYQNALRCRPYFPPPRRRRKKKNNDCVLM